MERSFEKNSSKHIVIVGYDPRLLSFFASVLEIVGGYRTSTFTSGIQALASAVEVIPDMILLDTLLPDISGYDICARVKADHRTQHIPVMFCSALDKDVGEPRAMNVGGVGYLTKPVLLNELLDQVDCIICAQDKQIGTYLPVQESTL